MINYLFRNYSSRPFAFSQKNSLFLKMTYESHREQKKKFFKIEDQPKEKSIQIFPNQYPKGSLNDTTPIIPRGRPPKYLTTRYEIPDEIMMDSHSLINHHKYGGQWKSPENAYSLNIGLIGPVNAGKSQLFSALSYPVSAISPKAATTTQIIHGIKSFERQNQEGLKNIQLKYFDTPGLMYRKQGFISKGWKVLSEIDFTLFVVDSAKRFDNMIKESIIRLERHREYPNFMKALVLNKIDLVDNRRKFDSLISQIQRYGKFDKIFYTSAKTNYGIQELQEYLIGMAKEGEWQYPPEVKTTLTDKQIVEEMLREGMFMRLYKQVPHDMDIQCISHIQKTDGTFQLIFSIYVMSQNQQRMVIGTKGANIQAGKNHFKVLFVKYYKKEVNVHINVKIKNKFRRAYPGRQQLIMGDYDRQDKERVEAVQDYLNSKRADKYD